MFSGQSRRDHTAMVYFGQFLLWPIPTLARSHNYNQNYNYNYNCNHKPNHNCNKNYYGNYSYNYDFYDNYDKNLMPHSSPDRPLPKPPCPRTFLNLDISPPDRPLPAPLPLDPLLCRTAQKFRSFFPLPPQFSFFLLSLGGPFVEFWWCFWDPQMCMFELSGCRVKPRRLWDRASHDSPRTPNVHISRPWRFKNTTQEREERMNIVAKE